MHVCVQCKATESQTLISYLPTFTLLHHTVKRERREGCERTDVTTTAARFLCEEAGCVSIQQTSNKPGNIHALLLKRSVGPACGRVWSYKARHVEGSGEAIQHRAYREKANKKEGHFREHQHQTGDNSHHHHHSCAHVCQAMQLHTEQDKTDSFFSLRFQLCSWLGEQQPRRHFKVHNNNTNNHDTPAWDHTHTHPFPRNGNYLVRQSVSNPCVCVCAV